MDHLYTSGVTLEDREEDVAEIDDESIIKEETVHTSDEPGNAVIISGTEEDGLGRVYIQMTQESNGFVFRTKDGNSSLNLKHLPEANSPGTNSLSTGAGHKWTRNAIKTLIQLRTELDEQFENPKNKKMDYWQYISNVLEESGFKITAHECHTKWRNLCGTYRFNKGKSQKKGSSVIRWEFFDAMDQFMRKHRWSAKAEGGEEILIEDWEEEEEDDSEDEEEMARLLQLQSGLTDKQAKRPGDFSEQFYKRSRSDSPPAWFKEYAAKREEEEKLRDDRFFAILESIKQSELRKTALLESLLQYFDRN